MTTPRRRRYHHHRHYHTRAPVLYYPLSSSLTPQKNIYKTHKLITVLHLIISVFIPRTQTHNDEILKIITIIIITIKTRAVVRVFYKWTTTFYSDRGQTTYTCTQPVGRFAFSPPYGWEKSCDGSLSAPAEKKP